MVTDVKLYGRNIRRKNKQIAFNAKGFLYRIRINNWLFPTFKVLKRWGKHGSHYAPAVLFQGGGKIPSMA